MRRDPIRSPQPRAEAASEQGDAGLARSSGSGAMRHPIAQAVATRRSFGDCLFLPAAGVLGWEAWNFVRSARQGVEQIIATAANVTSDALEHTAMVLCRLGDILEDAAERGYYGILGLGYRAAEVIDAVNIVLAELLPLFVPNEVTKIMMVVLGFFDLVDKVFWNLYHQNILACQYLGV